MLKMWNNKTLESLEWLGENAENKKKLEQAKSENEVAERVKTVQEWLLRAESAKGQQFLNYDCVVF